MIIIMCGKNMKQAGTVLGQAQLKLELKHDLLQKIDCSS